MKRNAVILTITFIMMALFSGYMSNVLTVDTDRLASLNHFGSRITNFVRGYPAGVQMSPPPTAIDYQTAQATIESNRQQLANTYKTASNSTEKQVALIQARGQFIDATTTLLPYWYGTPWDYNGTSDTPQQGDIACGYYVSTILEDSGLQVERRRLAQQASENIIKSLTNETYIKRFSNASLGSFIAAIDNWGEGLYIVGLDTHVGYIWHDGTEIHFIHSTIRGPRSAFLEPAATSPTLADSQYRVLGKISADDNLLIRWLEQKPIATKT